MSSYSLTAELVDDNRGRFVMVTRADDEIRVSDELWDDVNRPDRERITGDIEVVGDTLSVGTDSEGLGRLTYHRTDSPRPGFPWHTYMRDVNHG